MKKIYIFVMLCVLQLSLFGQNFSLRIIHNNDGESRLLPIDVDGRSIGGAAPFKTAVDSLRAEGTPNVMLSSGDNFLAGIVFEANTEGQPLFDAQVLDALDYDAICIGNHDLDFGPEVLAQMINDFSVTMPPYLSANLDFSQEPSLQALVDAGRIAPSTVVEVAGEQVGIIGLTTSNLASITSTGEIIIDTDILGVAQSQIAAMTDAGINKIIVISHLQGIAEEMELARQLTDVDVIIAGGGDELLSNMEAITLPGINVSGTYPLEVADADGNTTYIVTTPGEYRYVGNLIVEFDATGNITSIADESNPILVEGFAPDAALQSSVIDSVLAATANAQTFGITEVDLDGTRSGIRSRETNQGNLISDAFLFAAETNTPDNINTSLPIIALTNGGGIRNDGIVRANSTITSNTTQSMLPFGNGVVMLNPATPTQVKTILENAISAIGSGEGTGRFGQIGGFSFVYNPNETPSIFSEDGSTLLEEGNRIVSATIEGFGEYIVNGEPVEGAPNVYIVTNDFIAGGRDGYTTFGELGIFATLLDDYKVALDEYLVEGLNGVVTAAAYPEGGEGRITLGMLTSTIAGGSVATQSGATTLNICSGDDVSNIIQFTNDAVNESDVQYAYIMTYGDVIAGLAQTGLIEFEGSPTLNARMYGFAYTGNLTIPNRADINTAQLSDGEFALSDNFVEISITNGGCTAADDSEFNRNIATSRSTNLEGLVYLTKDGLVTAEEKMQNSIEVYPNPAVGELFMNLGALTTKEHIHIRLTDALGREVKDLAVGSDTNSVLQLNTLDYSNGIYFMNFYTGAEKVATKKIVISH